MATATMEAPAEARQPSPKGEHAYVKGEYAHVKGKYTFRVLAGRHWKPELVLDEDGKPIPKIGAGGKPIIDRKTKRPVCETRDVEYGPGSKLGDIVDSDERLDLKFNTPVSRKFELVGQDGVTDEMTEQLQRERQRVAESSNWLKSALQKMDRAGLAAWAEEHGIDVGSAVKRDDVLARVMAKLDQGA